MKNKVKNLHATDVLGFRSCPRQFYYSKILRIKSTDSNEASYFTEGHIGHLLLREHYTGVIQDYSSFDPTMVENFATLVGMHNAYYASEDRHYQTLACEDELTCEINGQSIIFTLDRLCLDTRDNTMVIQDHKFEKTLPNATAIDLRSQPFGYFIMSDLLGLVTSRFFFNVIKKKYFVPPNLLKSGPRKGMLSNAAGVLDNTTEQMYRNSIELYELPVEDYTEELAYLKTTDRMVLGRYDIARNKAREEHTKKDLIRTIDQINTTTEYDMHLGYGCQKCKYNKICLAEVNGYDKAGVIRFEFEEKADDER